MRGGEKDDLHSNDPDTRRTRQAQLLLFSGLAAAALVAFAVWLSAGGGGRPGPQGGIEAELAGSDTAEASWVRRSETRIGVIETRLREMETQNSRMQQENERLRERLAGDAEDARHAIDQQVALIDELQRREAAGAPVADAFGGDYFSGPGGGADAASNQAAAPATPAVSAGPMILEFEPSAAPNETTKDTGLLAASVRPLGTWLPAGSHAEAVVLSGVDASAGVASQGDPRPVLLRLTGPAVSAAEDGVALTADIEGCTLTGAAHGDLSSEKVYVRLQTLTCAGPQPETVIETQVAGFVAGTGKAGVRGPVVSREGALVQKAFLAGLVSGAGESATALLQPPAVITGGASSSASTVGLADLGRAGLAAGANSAGRRVSDYLIRRAEQYQPVIQLQTGIPVTVVFLEGARLDGRKDTGERP